MRPKTNDPLKSTTLSNAQGPAPLNDGVTSLASCALLHMLTATEYRPGTDMVRRMPHFSTVTSTNPYAVPTFIGLGEGSLRFGVSEKSPAISRREWTTPRKRFLFFSRGFSLHKGAKACLNAHHSGLCNVVAASSSLWKRHERRHVQ